ncbi:MAG: SoxR reducing system RseC family protein [Candidatus Thiodiazotropha sp.]|jgi:sigma-E factor negative regulatory protein RseC
MIEEVATVIRLDQEFAIVETQQHAPCGSCSSEGSCSTTILAGLFKRRNYQLKVLNRVDAKPGEQVIIGLQENILLKISFLTYLFPLISMILVAMLAAGIANFFDLSAGELPQVTGGLLGLISGLILIKKHAQKSRHDPDYQAVILRHANSASVQLV